MTDYAKMKNAELEALLKQRGLPHGGKKADMVARLQEDDSKKTTTEDVIDWDDEEPAKADAPAVAAPSEAPIPTTKTAAVAPVSNPAEATATGQETASTEDVVADKEAPAEKAKTPIDYSIGLADTTIDEEIEKRKARAKKFGMVENDPLAEEALMKLERAKKFGEAGGPRGLNEALPERQKRRHEGVGDGGRDFKRRGGGGRGGHRFNDRRRGQGPAPSGSQPSRVEKTAGSSGGSGWMSAADKAAAEARKARFAAPASK